nr:integrase core domain-containing protein [Aeromonas veronii]
MENPMGQGVKRTQRDYSLTFKLALVEQIEDIYNAERPHHALKYRTPDAVHRGF